jgi:hypothetical protein
MEGKPTYGEPWTDLSRSDSVLLSRDIATAIKELCSRPDRAQQILSVLNNRLRPLGVRMELVNGGLERTGSEG